VQVKAPPAGRQVQDGQQKPVQIMAPNSKGAVATGALPMVQVKMTQKGPQLDDGQNNAVVIMDNRQTVAAGALPMVQVRMDGGKPQVQTIPNVQGGPPQIPMAAPVLSRPRTVGRIAAPQQVQVYPQQIAQAPVQVAQVPQARGPELSIDGALFLRHRADTYISEHTSDVNATPDSTTANNLKIAEDAIFVLDQMIAAASSTEEVVEVTEPAAPISTAPSPAVRAQAVGYVAPHALSSTGRVAAPARGYVAPRPGGRNIRMGNASLAPRRVARAPQSQGGLPIVQVKMDGQRAVVQNQAEVAAAKAAQLQAEAEALVASQPAPVATAPAPETTDTQATGTP
jgi:hypothetical protein